tara:strand:+ start:360 stop:851 length:492 start_codon:yes stop_codon:yes gene_type:complete
MKNDIQAIEQNFIDAMGNGVDATTHLSSLFEASIVSHDFRPISNIINALNRIGDASGSRVVRSVFALIFPDSTVKKTKDGRGVVVGAGFDANGLSLDTAALDRMRGAVADKLSIREALVKRVKGKVEKPDVVLPKVMATLLKRMMKEGHSQAACVAALQAAQV